MAILSIEVVRETVFRFVDDNGKNFVFGIDRIRQWCEEQKIEVFRVPVDQNFVEYCLANRGIEPHRLARLNETICRREPVIFVRWFDDTCILIDGNHRFVWLAQHGFEEMDAYILERDQWQQFLINESQFEATDLIQSFSGIV